MSFNNANKYTKRELLEIMLAQKLEIESLEKEVSSLQEEINLKNQKIDEIADLVQVTNKLIRVANKMEYKIKSNQTKEKF